MIEQFFQPRSFRQALRLKARWGSDAAAVIGGTDLMVKIRAGRATPKAVIDLGRTGLGSIRRSKEWVRIGAGATAGDFLRLPWSRVEAPALWKSCLQLGGPQVQNGATFAGNLANASPAADTPPVLIVLGAEALIESLERPARWIRVEDFLLGPGKTVLQPDELIREIRFPRSALIPTGRGAKSNGRGRIVCDFQKMGPRRAQIISVACFAGWAEVDDGPGDAGGRRADQTDRTDRGEAGVVRVVGLRLAAGGVAPRTTRLTEAEAFILENGLTRETACRAADLARDAVAPISDIRGSAEYKSLLTRNFALMFLESLLPDSAKDVQS